MKKSAFAADWLQLLQVEIEQTRVGAFVFTRQRQKAFVEIEGKRGGVGIDGYETATGTVVALVGGDNHVDNKGAKPLTTILDACGQTANLDGWIALEHLATRKELLAETVVGRVAREVGKRYAVVGKAEITHHIASLRVLKNVARGQA